MHSDGLPSTNGLSTEDLELFAYLLEDEGVDTTSERVIPRRDPTAPIPLSLAQERMWFLDQWDPGNPASNIPFAVRLKGRLSIAAVEQSLNEIVRRHESLRTTFRVVHDQPRQIVAPSLSIPLPLIDLRSLPPAERAAEVQRLSLEHAQHRFDVTAGPLLRADLVRLTDQEHVFLLNIHHAVFDAWSVGLFLRELTVLYNAAVNNQPSPLPELPIQYGDFAIWQRAWLQGQLLQDQLAYWKRQLGGSLPVLELPGDHPRPRLLTHHGAFINYHLPADIREQVLAVSEAEGTTLFMTLFAAFQILLYRYTGHEDIITGSVIANRDFVDIEPLMGFFLNTLPLRSDLSGDPTVRAFLHRTREMLLEAYAHQSVPFEQLVEELRPPRDPSHTPLFQMMFILQSAPVPAQGQRDLEIEYLRVDNGSSKFDLSLSLTELPDGLRVAVEYKTDLFEVATIERLMGHYQTLLAGMAADLDQTISRLPLLTEAERRQQRDWNQTAVAVDLEQCIHAQFARQAARTPDATAMIFEGRSLSYAELNDRASRLANYLRSLGVGPETRVGLCLDRSLDLAVGVLGILKAGGAYVPLDPAYPQARLRYMLHDSEIAVLLTQEHLTDTLPTEQIRVVCLDRDWSTIAQASADDAHSGATPDNLAYVIYTSGSTGQPKGVAVSHRAIGNRIAWSQQADPLTADDRVLQVASMSFDIAFWELIGPLLYGATVVLAPPDANQDSDQLIALLVQEQVTVAHLVPSVLNLVLSNPKLAACRSLRSLYYGGEASAIDLPERIRAQLPVDLLHFYGPTEAAINATAWRWSPESPTVSIGRPISNMQAYLLDGQLQPVPVGVAGEIYLGGVGLARGYLNRPDLTAERFMPNPFGAGYPLGGSRIYRTGDLARYLPDGNIVFLGRADNQVKIRGMRIELGEIEAVLRQQPGVQQALVVVRDDTSPEGHPDARLVAYVVGENQEPRTKNQGVEEAGSRFLVLGSSELRASLKEHLPDYMVPSAFVMLETLPLTPNGKVDHKALPAPDTAGLEPDAAYVAPRTPVEELLANIWAGVLRRERVGVYDNFFDLGGHSLLATQVVSRVRDALQVDLPLRDVFAAPTLAGMAALITNIGLGETIQHAAPPLRPADRSEPLPLSFSQERLWFLYQLTPGSPLYNIPSALRLTGRLDPAALHRSFDALVERHAILRTTFSDIDGRPVQVIAPPTPVAITFVDLRDLPVDEREAAARELAQAEAQTPFDLAHGPLLRVTLLQLDEGDHVVLFTLHHIISDGWSSGIVIRELALLYMAYVEGRPAPMPELPIQYVDFAVWQRQWLQGAVLNQQLAYWQDQLAGSPAALELPTDRPRPPIQTVRGATLPFRIQPALSQALQSLSQREGATLFMTLLAAFQTLLFRYSGQDDILVGTPIANRTRQEIEGLIGMFVNTLVLRTKLSGNPTFSDLLGRVRQTTLGAFAHQDLPFERLVEVLQPTRDPSRSPLFQVMLGLQNAPSEALRLPDLTFEPIAVNSGTAKFDLMLLMTEDADGLAGSLEYNTDLFDHDTMTRLIDHYHTLLDGIVAHPEARLSDLPLVPAAEWQQMTLWNATRTSYPHDRCVHDLVAAQAVRTPSAPAVVFPDEVCRYDELNLRANQLAHYLQALGVGRGTPVGVCLDRSLAFVVSVLAILKAGGAYVPLDPTYPAERLRFMLEDTAAPVVITEAALAVSLPPHRAQLVCLDTDAERLSAQRTDNPAHQAMSEDPAYVIYTSGSTGRPKGVMVPHRAITRLVCNTNYVQFTADDRIGMVSNVSFDAATMELWGALLNGGRIVGVSREVALSPQRFADYIREQRIDTMFLTSALFNHMAHSVPGAFATMRDLLVGGDALDAHSIATVLAAGGPRRLLNGYGPTESTTFAATYEIAEVAPGATNIPIGYALANTQLYLLDRHARPVPIGVPGELCIGGAGLAHGYLNQPALTADKFVPDPFSGEFGARLYRTGDLARYRPDGAIEFLGRLDEQVKLRGFRIELGEIEAVLRQHPGVADVVVVMREDQPNDKRLIAYVVEEQKNQGTKEQTENQEPRTKNQEPREEVLSPSPAAQEREGEPATAGQGDAGGEGLFTTESLSSSLRNFIKERLPDYMLPSAVMTLEALPLTANGKVDRKALPAPDLSRSSTDEPFVAPRTPIEDMLANLMMELLQLERVGVHDNFFALGGHSLLAVQLIARIRAQLGIEVPVRILFESPTVAELGAYLQAAQAAHSDASPALAEHGSGADASLLSLAAYAEATRWAESTQTPTAQSADADLYEAGEL
ncbi:MAG TPA: amino acid adenylation domain-containing protein [Herpetosiphonaceae bacterium]